MRSQTSTGLLISTREFILLAALLMCLTALSIDIMLPVLPEIAAALDVADDNARQYVVSSYLAGLVFGQLFVGPLSDKYGRLPVLATGLVVFVAAALYAGTTISFEGLLVARMVQGIGGAAPRIVIVAVVRDLFDGRQMAQIMSLVMTIFIMVPVFAPSLGQLLAYGGGWRVPFLALGLIGTVALVWSWWRLQETAPRHVQAAATGNGSLDGAAVIGIRDAIKAVFSSRTSVGYIAASGSMFGCLMAYILSSQQIFVDVYGLGAWFPIAFGGVAVGMAIAGLVNSAIVVRLGMRFVGHRALGVFLVLAAGMAVVSVYCDGRPPLWLVWSVLFCEFFCFGLIVSNFNALAMEPLGSVAGMASSVMGLYTTLSGAVLGTIVGQFFDMTVIPLTIGFFVFSLVALCIVLVTETPAGFGKEPAA